MKNLFYVALIILFFIGCEEDCEKLRNSHISKKTIPKTASVLDTVQLEVTAFASNGCWSDLFVELNQQSAFEYTVEAFGTLTCCDECVCPQVEVEADTIINFVPDQKGVYLFYVSQLNNQIDVDTLIVN